MVRPMVQSIFIWREVGFEGVRIIFLIFALGAGGGGEDMDCGCSLEPPQ